MWGSDFTFRPRSAWSCRGERGQLKHGVRWNMALFSTVCNIWRCRHHCASALDHFLCQRRLGGKRTVILIWHLFLCFWGAFGRNRFYEYFVISHIPLFAERRTPGSGITPYLALHSAWCRPSSSFDMCFTARARWRERMGSIETLFWGSVETGPQAVSIDPGDLCNGYCSGAVNIKGNSPPLKWAFKLK